MNIYGSNLFARKWLCNHKHFRPKIFWWNVLVQTYSRGNDFANIKNFWPKKFCWKFLVQTYSRGNDFATIKICWTKECLLYIFGSNLFPRKWFCNHKKFLYQNIFHENVWFTHIPVEIIFQQLKIFDQKIFADNVWLNPTPEEMIFEP